jgi:hypothetical protein
VKVTVCSLKVSKDQLVSSSIRWTNLNLNWNCFWQIKVDLKPINLSISNSSFCTHIKKLFVKVDDFVHLLGFLNGTEEAFADTSLPLLLLLYQTRYMAKGDSADELKMSLFIWLECSDWKVVEQNLLGSSCKPFGKLRLTEANRSHRLHV